MMIAQVNEGKKMNIGEFVLNSKLINNLEESLQKMPKDEIPMIKATALGISFITDMMVEVIESHTIASFNLDMTQLGRLSIDIIAGAAAIAAFRFGSRTADINFYIQHFKHQFETILLQLKENNA
jgi:hypothetical protein